MLAGALAVASHAQAQVDASVGSVPLHSAAAALRGEIDACLGAPACLDAIGQRLDAQVAGVRGQDRLAYDFLEGWLLFRRGDAAAAASRLEAVTGYLHHTLAVPALFHDALGDVYASLDRTAAAQGQWWLAVAAAAREESGAEVAAQARRKLAASGPLPRFLPIHRSDGGAWFVDLASIRRDGAQATYAWLVLWPRTRPDGGDYMRVEQEVRCGESSGRRHSARVMDATGKVLDRAGEGGWDAPTGALVANEWALACAFDGRVDADAGMSAAALLLRDRLEKETE